MPGRLSRFKLLSVLFVFFLMSSGTILAQCPTLVWSDEFDGDAVNEANWSFQTGGSGWGNNELQYYRPENVTVSGGTLKITAKREDYGGRNYTSTRMHSIGKADFTYGRFEARIKMTSTQGIWPAFWMMPTESVHGGWPRSGEIDIMENLGSEPSITHGTIHYGNPNHRFTGQSFHLFNDRRFADQFHIFAVEKEPNQIRWYVDGINYLTLTPDDIAPEFWPFEEAYHFILNLAVGGNWPGNPDETTVFPQTLEVDYIRVYSGSFPSIAGDRKLTSRAAGRTYSVNNAPPGTLFFWAVPEGATISSGQNTNTITVDWGLSGGNVLVLYKSVCTLRVMAINVQVDPPVTYDFSFENFDDPERVTFMSTSGVLTEIDNPDRTGINTSARSGQYIRNATSPFDTLIYATTAIPDGAEIIAGNRRFFIDVFTTAPVGSEILLQSENSNATTPVNYPAGRHSRFQAFTSVRNGWERLEFKYLDRPDSGTDHGSIDSMVLLFAPNTQSGDTWIFDNLDSYVETPVKTSGLPKPEG